MRVLLVNVDARFNIALRRLRRCYIEAGDEAEEMDLRLPAYPHGKRRTIDASGYDKVYVSNLFDINADRVGIYGCEDIDYGGIGSRNPANRIPP